MKASFTYWKATNGRCLGYLNAYPDHWTQGENLDDLEEHLRDFIERFGTEEIPGIRTVDESGYRCSLRFSPCADAGSK
jgi:hypothetical protein